MDMKEQFDKRLEEIVNQKSGNNVIYSRATYDKIVNDLLRIKTKGTSSAASNGVERCSKRTAEVSCGQGYLKYLRLLETVHHIVEVASEQETSCNSLPPLRENWRRKWKKSLLAELTAVVVNLLATGEIYVFEADLWKLGISDHLLKSMWRRRLAILKAT
ncbi:Adenylosuccinate synthetase [Trichinella spiralis]|uniref:Adenylosuccinate synthetase n=1 Tax=Trichinella spiralis TaxID=6334 RepID=A0ABR3K1H5_TRISP